MAILKLSENLYISPQLSEADAAQAAKLGIKSVICNRPDGEEAGQPEAAQVRQWLEQAGIAAFRHQPVTAPAITDADIDTAPRHWERPSDHAPAWVKIKG